MTLLRVFKTFSKEGLSLSAFLNNSLKVFACNSCSSVSDYDQFEFEKFDRDSYDDLIPRSLRVAGMPHQVFIIQPYIKWGIKKLRNTTPLLQLEESIALVKTLPGWKVSDSRLVPLLSFDKKSLFNQGNLKNLSEFINNQECISAVYINIKSLKLHQHLYLETTFGVPVFDRYSIIINIFKHHAKTKEARLQVALAEIPYIGSRIEGINESESEFIRNVGIGSGETFKETRKRLLLQREIKIKGEIAKLAKSRDLLRQKRKSLEIATVAIVGYTNAGKTSLIKCLTREDSLQPEDKLFATLDVTTHAGHLPNNIKALFIDTIGFISDVPPTLLQPFIATLEDALQANVIVHVQDISHPDKDAQFDHVKSTIRGLNLPKIVADNIIIVGNKCDKASNLESSDNMILTSCLKMTGIDELKMEIERKLLITTGMRRLRIKVRSGSDEFQWLYKEASVSGLVVDKEDSQFLILNVTISQAKLAKFKHMFINGKSS